MSQPDDNPMAGEMAAASARCDVADRAKVAEFTALLRECQRLGGCAGVAPQ